VERQFDSPIEPRFRPRDAKIAVEFLNGIAQLGLPKIGNDRVLARIEITQKPILVLAEFEIVILLFALFDHAPLGTEFAIGPAFLVGQELLLSDGIKARLLVLVDLFLVMKALQ